MKHTDEFYKKQYDKYAAAAQEYGGINAFAGLKQPLESFAAAYEIWASEIRQGNFSNKGSVVKTMAYMQKYPTSYKTAAAMRNAIEQETGKRWLVKNVQQLSWAELQEEFGDVIHGYYESLKAEGKTSSESRRIISLYFYGSK